MFRVSSTAVRPTDPFAALRAQMELAKKATLGESVSYDDQASVPDAEIKILQESLGTDKFICIGPKEPNFTCISHVLMGIQSGQTSKVTVYESDGTTLLNALTRKGDLKRVNHTEVDLDAYSEGRILVAVTFDPKGGIRHISIQNSLDSTLHRHKMGKGHMILAEPDASSKLYGKISNWYEVVPKSSVL